MAIGLAHVNSRKIEKKSLNTATAVESVTPKDSQLFVSTPLKKSKPAHRSGLTNMEFDETESTWMSWCANRVTAAPASTAMATISRLCALEDKLLGWAESQIATRLQAQK